jgi:poly(A) polymerase
LIHPALSRIRDSLTGTKYEQDVFLVGGAVRDQLLGRTDTTDFDLVSEQSGIEIAQSLFSQGISSIHPVTFESFGTAMVIVDGIKIEIIQCRKESYHHGSRKPDVSPGTYRDDAERRDFTLNSLQLNLWTEQIVDILGTGLSDLQQGILRTPLDPHKTFQDDPLRILRAIRFKHRFGFQFAEGLDRAIRIEADQLQHISHERIRDEILKITHFPTAAEALSEMMTLGLLEQFAIDFVPTVGCDQGKFHHLDVWNHTLAVVKNSYTCAISHPPFNESLHEEEREILTLACLFHDIGKPKTRKPGEKGAVHFYTHEHVGAEITTSILKEWRLPSTTIERISKLVKHHMRLASAHVFSLPAARRLLRDLGEDWSLLLRLIDADSRGLKANIQSINLETIVQQINTALTDQAAPTFEPPLNGEEIMQCLGIPPGPQIKKYKDLLSEKVLDGELLSNDQEKARQIILAEFNKHSRATN